MQSTHVIESPQSTAHSDLVKAVLNQEWRRYADEQQINGVEMASRLHRSGVYASVHVALVAVRDSWVNDTIKTGVSAWVRIA